MTLIRQITSEVFVTWGRLRELGFRVDVQFGEQRVLRFSQAEWVALTLGTNYSGPVEFWPLFPLETYYTTLKRQEMLLKIPLKSPLVNKITNNSRKILTQNCWPSYSAMYLFSILKMFWSFFYFRLNFPFKYLHKWHTQFSLAKSGAFTGPTVNLIISMA